MENPWKELIKKVNDDFIAEDQKYIIEDDLKVIQRYNENSFRTEKSRTNYKVFYRMHPSHYSGNIKKAKVLLLASNPGYQEEEEDTLYKNKSFHKEKIENLEFKSDTLFNSDKERLQDGNYWEQKTRRLQNDIPGKNIFKDIALIQFFPYHSKKYRKIAKKYFGNGERYLKTQKFGFDLVKDAIKEGKLIIILRSKKDWLKAVPELEAHRDKGLVLEVINYRQPSLTPNNFTDKQAYDTLIKTLK